MKVKLFLFCALATNTLFAQKDAKELTFFGFDFSKVKFIGKGEFNNPASIRENEFLAWNRYFDERRNESECSVKKHFRKEVVEYDYDIVKKRNQETELKDIVTDNLNYHIDDATIASMIKSYDSKQKGLGLVIVVEALNKPKELVTMYATFFDIQTQKVILVKPMKGAASGMFGFRNYWQSGLVRGFRSFKYE